MNMAQKAVILIGIAIILLLVLYPPWVHVTGEKGYPKMETASIYGPIFHPPKEPIIDKYIDGIVKDSRLNSEAKREVIEKFFEKYRWGVILDTPRLLVQWAMVIITVTGLCLVLKKSR